MIADLYIEMPLSHAKVSGVPVHSGNMLTHLALEFTKKSRPVIHTMRKTSGFPFSSMD